jgi:hypothetical protein
MGAPSAHSGGDFDVPMADESAPGAGPEISDEDIPF